MNVQGIEKALRPTSRSKFRPLFWMTIASYAMEPPERFCGIEVLCLARSNDDPLAARVGGTSVYAELRNLDGLEMIERVPSDDPYSRVNWFVRTDQQAWDAAIGVLQAGPDFSHF